MSKQKVRALVPTARAEAYETPQGKRSHVLIWRSLASGERLGEGETETKAWADALANLRRRAEALNESEEQ